MHHWRHLLIGLEDEYELDAGFVRSEKVNLVLASPPYSTRGAQGRSNSARDVCS